MRIGTKHHLLTFSSNLEEVVERDVTSLNARTPHDGLLGKEAKAGKAAKGTTAVPPPAVGTSAVALPGNGTAMGKAAKGAKGTSAIPPPVAVASACATVTETQIVTSTVTIDSCATAIQDGVSPPPAGSNLPPTEIITVAPPSGNLAGGTLFTNLQSWHGSFCSCARRKLY